MLYEIITDLGNSYFVKISKYTLEDFGVAEAAAAILNFPEDRIVKTIRH